MNFTSQIVLDHIGQDNRQSEVLVFEGRLDNREDLLMRLHGLGTSEASNSSLALGTYQRFGPRGLVHLIGDWSLVIRDTVNQMLVLASDFAGVRPLYYCEQQGRIYWSTRLASLVEATRITELDDLYVAGFLQYGGCPNRTPYKGIRSVPPGHAVCISASETTIRPFWALPVGDTIRYTNEHRYDEQLRALFREAVAVRLPKNSNVLAELSGGLDSSSIVSMATRLLHGGSRGASRLRTVSYVWPNSRDLPFIQEMESACEIERLRISTQDFPLMNTTQIGTAMPEPFGPLRGRVAEIAQQSSATVLLTGQGGDLMLGNWFNDSLQVAAHLRELRLGRSFRESLAWSKILHVPVYWILWRALQAALPPALTPADVFSILDGSHTPHNTETSLTPEFSRRTGALEPDRFFSNTWMKARAERRKYFRALSMMLELRSLQAPEALQHLDYTHPFAHRPLVEFLMTVPADVLCVPGEPRKLMRRALSDLWPPMLRKRRSKGLFSAPWQESLRPLAVQLLQSSTFQVVERGFVDGASFLKRLNRLSFGLDCNQSQLQCVILLELWLRRRDSDAAHRAA